MKISHDIFKKINIQIDLENNTYSQICDIFKKHNIKCSVENMRLLLNGIVDMDLDDICIEVDATLRFYENIDFEYQFDMEIVEKLILNQSIDFELDDLDIEITNPTLKLEIPIAIDLDDLCVECYGQLIISMSVGSTKSVTVGDCKNLTLFQYYSDTLDTKVSTTREITIGQVKDNTLFEYYNNTNISMSVGSTKSVTVGDCKNLTLFQYYSDTLDTKVSTTREITIGQVKDNTLFEYYNNTNIS